MSERNTGLSSSAVRLSRTLTLNRAVALGTSVTIGLGVYALLGQFNQVAGAASLAAGYLLLAVSVIPIILTLAERAGVIPGNSVYNLVRGRGGLSISFSTGWLLLGGFISLIALLGWGVALHVNIILVELFDVSVSLAVVAVIIILLAGLNNVVGTWSNWRTRTAVVFLAITFLILLIARGFFVSDAVSTTVSYLAPQSITSIELAALMACCLWGLYLIVDSRDEIQQPTRNVWLSLLLSTLLLGGLGILSAFVLRRYPGTLENPLLPLLSIRAQFQLVDPALFSVIYGLFGAGILLTALNRAYVGSLNLVNVMRVDGFFPARLESLTTLRNVPVLVLGFFSGLSALLLILLPTLSIAKLASHTFLWSVALVHVPDLLRPDPGLPQARRPRLPFHPLFPGLTVAVGALLPVALLRDIWGIVVAWLILGVIYYWRYAHRRGLHVRSSEVMVGARVAKEAAAIADYRVLVAVFNPDTAAGLIHVAADLARSRSGDLLILSTLQLADQVPTHLKHEQAQEKWEDLNAIIRNMGLDDPDVQLLVRLSPSPSEGILGTLEEEKVDLLVLGWEGQQRPDEMNQDPVIGPIMRRAQCNVALIGGAVPHRPKRVLVPSAGSPHAMMALQLAKDLVHPDDGVIKLVNLVTEDHAQHEGQEQLRKTRLGAGLDTKIVQEDITTVDSVEQGILTHAQQADLLILGASRQGLVDRAYFGGLAASIAAQAPVSTIVARQEQPERFRPLLHLWDSISGALPTLTAKSQDEVIRDMQAASVPSIDFFVLIVLASAIAILGLLQNSAAVIIGAMLVAPLMSPIIAIGLNMVLDDLAQLKVAAEATLKGITLAILVGIVISLISPIDEPTAEIMGRTQPNILDLMVALFSGAAAGYAISRKEVAAALPGVAIAAALVPPLTVVGYGFALGRLDIASGSLLLFTTNLIAIILAAAIVFLALGFQPRRTERGELLRGLQITVVSLLGIGIILGATTVITVRQINLQQAVEAVFNSQIVAKAARVEDLAITPDKDGFKMEALVLSYSGQELTPEELVQLEEQLVEAAEGPITLDATTLKAERSLIAVEGMASGQQLEEDFSRAITALNAQPLDVAALETGPGYTIQATLIAFDMEAISDEALGKIQQELSEQSGAPVTIRVTILPGRRAELVSDELATSTP